MNLAHSPDIGLISRIPLISLFSIDRMQDSGILSVIAMVVSVAGTVLGILNHRRIRSNCCGRKLEASIDVEQTTPPQPKLEVKIPNPQTEA